MPCPPRLYQYILEIVEGEHSARCWSWLGALNNRGRPMVSYQGRNRYAYQVAYEERYGPVPEGLELHHTCWNKWCWNPDHVEPVSRQDNALSGPVLNQDTCPQGHPMTPENTQVYPRCSRPRADGSLGTFRVCRECHRQHSLEYQAREVVA